MSRFVRPQYAGGSLPNVGTTLLAATGHDRLDPPVPLAEPLEPTIDPLRGRRAEGPIVLVVMDSLGWRSFRTAVEGLPRSSGSPDSTPWADAAIPITAVFPSTTTAGLTSLSTATPPARHGIVGHRQYLPRWGVIADMLRMSPMTTPGQDTLIGPGWTRAEITPAPTVFELGLRAAVLSRDRFQGTGFTRLLYEGAEFCPYSTATDLAVELAEVLNRSSPPEVIHVYWDELDTVHHLRGPESSVFALELHRLAGLLAWSAAKVEPTLRRRCSLWITGDHGQVPSPASANLALERHPELLAELAHPPAGDRRAGFFAVRPGRREHFREALEPLLPAETLYLPMEEAIETGLFGGPPFHPELSLRTGDLLVVPPQPAGFTYSAPGNPVPRRLFAGAHSGLEREEVWVPLIAGPLDELTGSG